MTSIEPKGKLALPAIVKRALDQAVSSLAVAPDGSVVLVRKAVQLVVTSRTPKGRGWHGRLKALLDSDELTPIGVRAAHRVNVFGDWGAHVPRGLSAEAAGECLDYGRIVLFDLDYDVSGFGDDEQLDRLVRYIQYVTDSEWSASMKFGSEIGYGLPNGGLADILFACPGCGSEVLLEDLEVPTPSWVADSVSESEAGSGAEVACVMCDSFYDLESTCSTQGWSFDLVPQERNTQKRPLRNHEMSHRELPPEWEYFYRITWDGNRYPPPEE